MHWYILLFLRVSLFSMQLEACAHPFFDELREPNARLPNGRPFPSLFNFKQEVCLQFHHHYMKFANSMLLGYNCSLDFFFFSSTTWGGETQTSSNLGIIAHTLGLSYARFGLWLLSLDHRWPIFCSNCDEEETL